MSLSRQQLLKTGVWIARLLLGLTFILSGLSKAIDLWGFVYKIEEYIAVWELPWWRSLSFVCALGISSVEFVVGCMLLVGAFRKTAAWWAFAIMLFMLPLSLYIYISNPVNDCGCFGDFWVISNGATFAKNIVIMGVVIFLLKYNGKAGTLYDPYVQWIPLVFCSIYIIIVGLIGYNIQPLVDFRSFPIGSRLLTEEDLQNTDLSRFVYEKNGKRETFTLETLPDSTWIFVERVSDASDTNNQRTDFSIIEDGLDIAPDIISEEGLQLLLIIPELDRADISLTPLINETVESVVSDGGSVTALVAGDSEDLEYWRDISLGAYPMYNAEPTLLKELSRGIVSEVLIKDGIIECKRTASSLTFDKEVKGTPGSLIHFIINHGDKALVVMTLALSIIMFVLAIPRLVRNAVEFIKAHKKEIITKKAE